MSVSYIFLTNSLRQFESSGHILYFLECAMIASGVRLVVKTHKLCVDGMMAQLTAVIRVGTRAYTLTV